jgi:hypothetical protein
VFENVVPRIMFEPNRRGRSGGWRTLQREGSIICNHKIWLGCVHIKEDKIGGPCSMHGCCAKEKR